MVSREYDNEPLIGATVQIKGTDRGTCADLDGNFSIEVEKGDTLKFSCVGYLTKEIEILNDSSLFIELDDDPKPLDGFILFHGGCKRIFNHAKNQNIVIKH